MTAAKRAHQLIEMLDEAPAEVRILSLDCFDTLIWRNTHAPIDIFCELPRTGGGIVPRRFAEEAARAARHQADGKTEVFIEAIMARMAPDAAEAMVAQELAAEARHCFAFAPTVALIEEARRRGLRIVIVSDTYLSEPQLRGLIATVAGQDVADAIERIFCSSEHGLAKSDGLFGPVLAALGVPAGAILHAGDNHRADVEAPGKLGVHAVHFDQFAGPVAQQLRFEAAAAAMIDPATGVTQPVLQPHRAALSLRADDDPASLLGHDVFGPVMAGFARWIRAEADALALTSGRRVKPLFLLRDGHLPHLVFRAMGVGDAAAIEISRFTARRASFTDVEAIRHYLADERTHQVPVLGRQLLLEEGEIARFADHKALRRAVVERQWVDRIVSRSARFADRLAAHVRREGNVEAGDLLLFVDLGYNGTVQTLVEGVLRNRLGVEIAGRYLVLREPLPSGCDKKGLIDDRHYDHRTLGSLVRQVATLEQLSTAAQPSVIDYRVDGTPVRKRGDIKGAQSVVRQAVQQACLAYPASEAAAKHRPAASDGPDADRRMIAASLARLLFLPREEEVALLRGFDHDVNLGTDETVKLIDDDAAADGLQQRGLGYLAGVERMFVSGELQRHGLPLTLSLFAIGRYGLDLRQSDFQAGGIEVPLLVAGTTEQFVTAATAYPTHDGYYLLTVPMQARGFAVGVQFGAMAEIVQIASVGVHPATAFALAETAKSLATSPILDGMERIADGLHRCSEQALLFVPPVATPLTEPLLLAIVFRPIVRRARKLALKVAA